jgi:hypothetical protein
MVILPWLPEHVGRNLGGGHCDFLLGEVLIHQALSDGPVPQKS